MGGNWGGTGSGKSRRKRTRKEGLKKESGKKDGEESCDILLVSTLVRFLSVIYVLLSKGRDFPRPRRSFSKSSLWMTSVISDEEQVSVFCFVFSRLRYQEGETGRLSRKAPTRVL